MGDQGYGLLRQWMLKMKRSFEVLRSPRLVIPHELVKGRCSRSCVHHSLLRAKLSRFMQQFLARILFLTSIIVINGCERIGSRVDRVLECPSPNGHNVATFFRISGGGAAGFQDEYVSIRSANADFDPERAVVLHLGYGYQVRLTWEGNSLLRVEYPASASLRSAPVEQLTTDGGTFQIRFSTLPDQSGIFIDPTTAGCGAAVVPSESASIAAVQTRLRTPG